MALADKFVVFDGVQFLKDSFDNRNKIRNKAGEFWLTAPVLTEGKFPLLLADAQIDNRRNWNKKHLMSIEQCYSRSPYFDKYIEFFREVYSKQWDKLTDLCDVIFRFLVEKLGIKTEILYAHKLNLEGAKSDLVLDMCKKLGADLFIFGKLGRDYAKQNDFQRSNIKIYFQDYNHPVYPQFCGSNFISHLSVIDLLFNVGGEKALEVIMSGNITKDELQKGFLL